MFPGIIGSPGDDEGAALIGKADVKDSGTSQKMLLNVEHCALKSDGECISVWHSGLFIITFNEGSDFVQQQKIYRDTEGNIPGRKIETKAVACRGDESEQVAGLILHQETDLPGEKDRSYLKGLAIVHEGEHVAI